MHAAMEAFISGEPLTLQQVAAAFGGDEGQARIAIDNLRTRYGFLLFHLDTKPVATWAWQDSHQRQQAMLAR